MLSPRVDYEGFVADKVALARDFLRLLQFSSAYCNSISGPFSDLSSGAGEIGPMMD